MNVGETFKGYKIIKSIGNGANAEVWLAEKDGFKFALKSLLSKGNEGIDKSKFGWKFQKKI